MKVGQIGFINLKQFWTDFPLRSILLIALIVRLLAAYFSKGFAFYDDHFLIIYVADMWVNKVELWYEHVGHRFTYQFIHYILLHIMAFLQIYDPQIKMTIIRVLHAIFSTIMIYYAYLIVRHLYSEALAKKTGILLALYWIFPFMSVRNLGEFVCVVPLVAGYYYFYTADNKRQTVLAGVLFSIAITFRFQLLFLFAGLFIVLSIEKKWDVVRTLLLTLFIALFILQGIPDIISNGYPFEAFFGTVSYNVDNALNYLTGPWYRYSLLILGLLIPPTSILLIAAFFRANKYSYLFWPSLLFIVMHSLFPNKQERFILPVIPFLLILAMIGLELIKEDNLGKRFRSLINGLMIWFYLINTILLIIFTFTYSKKSRVESLYYLSHKTDISAILMEREDGKVPRPPLFYLNQANVPVFQYGKSTQSENEQANYIIFLGENNLQKRIDAMELSLQKKLEQETVIEASLIDQIVYRLNPKHNINETSYIYKVKANDRDF